MGRKKLPLSTGRIDQRSVPIIPECDLCGQEMKLSLRLPDGKNKRGLKYRRIRYHCDLCDIYHTQYCDGSGDDAFVQQAIKEAKNV